MAKTIMIVDDSASMRRVVGIALKGAGYDVIEGCDGKDAIGKLTLFRAMELSPTIAAPFHS